MTRVVISVTAISRVGPYFVPSVPVGVAREHEAPYSRLILNLTAMTRDANQAYDAGPFHYRQVTYTDVFDVDDVTGAVRARVSLDRQQTDQYNVSLYVDNSASPPHSSFLFFTVSDSSVCFVSVAIIVEYFNAVGREREGTSGLLKTTRIVKTHVVWGSLLARIG